MNGSEVHFEVHSTDASSGVAVTMYEAGSTTAYTLPSGYRIIVDHLTLVTVNGGDCYVNVGADATPAAGEYVLRGTFASNGGTEQNMVRTPYIGITNGTMWVTAPAGVVDVFGQGRVQRM